MPIFNIKKTNGELKEEVKQEAKNMTKKAIKEVIKQAVLAILPYFVIILVIVILASAIFSVFSEVTNSINGLAQNILSMFTLEEEGMNGIKIEDDQLDKIIETIEELGVDFEDLGILRRSRL